MSLGIAGLRPAASPRGPSPEPGSVCHSVPGLPDPPPGHEATSSRAWPHPEVPAPRPASRSMSEVPAWGIYEAATRHWVVPRSCPAWGGLSKGAAHPPSPLPAPPGAWASGLGGSRQVRGWRWRVALEVGILPPVGRVSRGARAERELLSVPPRLDQSIGKPSLFITVSGGFPRRDARARDPHCALPRPPARHRSRAQGLWSA